MISIVRRRLVVASFAPLFPGIALAKAGCDKQTAAETAGPFFKTASPQRASLVDKDSSGMKLLVSGRVLGPDCKPLANAKLDFWHADEHGIYHDKTYRYRGHQFTDAEGRYRLETVRPAEYPGRTRHIHVKVQPAGGRTLTTQLYFPGETLNKLDPLYRKDLEMALEHGDRASFDFVVDV